MGMADEVRVHACWSWEIEWLVREGKLPAQVCQVFDPSLCERWP